MCKLRRNQGGTEGAIANPKMPKNTFLQKIVPNFVIFLPRNFALEAYNDHSGIRSASSIQEKFLAI